ncbi:hypothetical protein E2C01_004630 [Portunus trituberculatus]|uniref:Uncharacterized protein n=1 Tax=Portunus trituberculatus TaxID=210409 RepID=A0A5B7CTH6_PORTR|nr:hypothetical protein [Portunus trituberculatus]
MISLTVPTKLAQLKQNLIVIYGIQQQCHHMALLDLPQRTLLRSSNKLSVWSWPEGFLKQVQGRMAGRLSDNTVNGTRQGIKPQVPFPTCRAALESRRGSGMAAPAATAAANTTATGVIIATLSIGSALVMASACSNTVLPCFETPGAASTQPPARRPPGCASHYHQGDVVTLPWTGAAGGGGSVCHRTLFPLYVLCKLVSPQRRDSIGDIITTINSVLIVLLAIMELR